MPLLLVDDRDGLFEPFIPALLANIVEHKLTGLARKRWAREPGGGLPTSSTGEDAWLGHLYPRPTGAPIGNVGHSLLKLDQRQTPANCRPTSRIRGTRSALVVSV